MKVLQINAIYGISSTGRTVTEMENILTKKGHIAVSAYSKGVSVDKNSEFIIGNLTDAKVHALLSRINGKQGSWSFSSTRKLLKFMDEFSPDIVILRNLHANYINLSMLLRYLAKRDIATVVVLHDCWFYTGGCYHYTKAGCRKWQDSCGNCPIPNKARNSWFFDRTRGMLKVKKKLFGSIPRLAVVGVSKWLTGEAKKAVAFSNAKIFKTIYNWIDGETFKARNADELREKLGLSDKKVILCVASGWSVAKGLNTVMELSEKLCDDERILLLGNVNEKAALNDKIIHIPPTNSTNELSEYYSLADVFVQPSLEETFGKVTAEALSCGTPAVCFDSTANPELIGDGCGAVVPIGDTDAMLEEIRRIFADGKAVYADSCRDFAEKNFNMAKNIKEYIGLFEELLDRG